MSIQSNFPAIKPTLLLDFANTKQLDPRITFTRSTTATYYDGVTTAKAEENLINYSQSNYDTSWNNNSTSIVVNSSAAPDGTATAALVSEVAATSYHFLSSNSVTITAGLPYTQSLFAKAGTVGVIQLVFAGTPFGTAAYANFDLSTGALGTVGSSATATITSVGSGWYRCTITATATSTASSQNGVIVGLCNNSTTASRLPSYAGNTTNNVYIWGAQLEQRSSVTAYTATTTQPITNYIPVLQTAAANVARFDHNPTTNESLGLLIEESRTNLLTYSEQFDNAAWTKSNSSITANTIVSPDGTVDADKLVEDTATSSHGIFSATAPTTTIGVVYTVTVFAKKAERNFLQIFFTGGHVTGNPRANYDLNAGTLGTVDSEITATITAVGNGWYRCVATVTAATTALRPFLHLVTSSSAARNESYTGDGYSGIYIWGAQLEAGAFATSYIPTVASQVTRAGELVNMTGTNFSSWYNQAEGTFYAEFVPSSSDFGSNKNIFLASDDTSSNFVGFRYGSSGSQPAMTSQVSSVLQANVVTGAMVAGANYKLAGAYALNSFTASRNAGTVGADNVGTVPTVTRAEIGSLSSTTITSQTIKKLAYYPLRVTNAQLQALTTV